MRLLLHALLLSCSLGTLHLLLLRRRPLPIAWFCALGGVAHVVIGLSLMGGALVANAARAWTTAAWLPALAVGLFVSGVVLALAWLGVVKGLEWAIARRAGGGRGESG